MGKEKRQARSYEVGDRHGWVLREGDRVLVGDEWAGEDDGKIGRVVRLQVAPHHAVRLEMEQTGRDVVVLAGLVDVQPASHAGYLGSGLARCGAPPGAYTVAPGEPYTCTACAAAEQEAQRAAAIAEGAGG